MKDLFSSDESFFFFFHYSKGNKKILGRLNVTIDKLHRCYSWKCVIGIDYAYDLYLKPFRFYRRRILITVSQIN